MEIVYIKGDGMEKTIDFIKEAAKIKKVSDQAISTVTNSSKMNAAFETDDTDTLREIIKDQNRIIKELKDAGSNANLDLTPEENRTIAAINQSIISGKSVFDSIPEEFKPNFKDNFVVFNNSIAAAQQAILSCPVIRAVLKNNNKKS